MEPIFADMSRMEGREGNNARGDTSSPLARLGSLSTKEHSEGGEERGGNRITIRKREEEGRGKGRAISLETGKAENDDDRVGGKAQVRRKRRTKGEVLGRLTDARGA